METLPFDRLLPPSDRYRGSGLRVALWSIAEAILLGVFAATSWLLIDLFDHQGVVRLASEDFGEARELVGERSWASFNLPDEIPLGRSTICDDSGLFPTLWQNRTSRLSRLLGVVFRQSSWLQRTRGSLTMLVLALVVIASAWLLTARRRRASGFRWAIETASQLRSSVHRQALRLGPSDLEDRSQQTAFDLFTTDVDRVRDALNRWAAVVTRVPAWIVVFTIIAVQIHWRISLQCIVPALLGWWFYKYEQERAEQRLAVLESQVQSQLKLLSESLKKTRIVRGYGMEQFEQTRFQSALARFVRDSAVAFRDSGWELRTARLVGVGCLGTVAFILGAHRLSPVNSISLADSYLTTFCIGIIVYAADRWMQIEQSRTEINTAAGNIQRYLDEIPEVGQAVGARFIEPLSKLIIFDSVDYSRNGKILLSKFDLRLAAQETVALIATDPLSARTAAHMLPRFIEPQAGRVLFDSEDLAWGTLESIRAETLYVGGSDPFFSGTVLENLTCGDASYTFSQVTDAAKIVHAHQFVLRLRQGYETAIGEHGESLGAGEAFLLGLARALLRQPAVLIIEEPNASLDSDIKAALDDAYSRLIPKRTVIFLPRRMSTLRRCDHVVLIHEGRVAAAGAQAELVQQSEMYRHWEYITFNNFRRKTKT